MPVIATQLSDRAVSRIKEDGRHAVGGVAGLHLRVKGAHRGWVLRIVVGDKRCDYGLGAYPDVSLSDARAHARKIRDGIRQGRLVSGTRAELRKALVEQASRSKTFRWCADEYLRSKSNEWKNSKNAQQWANTLRDYVMPIIGDTLVSDITVRHVLECLNPIWIEKNETASRVRGRIQSVLDWATVSTYRSGDNPARWTGHLDKLLAAPSKIQNVQHHRAVAVDAIPVFMDALKKRQGVSARALEFLVLTAARSGEVRGATWSEFDFENLIWTIPATRMKAKVEHRVPVTPAVLSLLRGQTRQPDTDLVFPATKLNQLSDASMSAVLKRMEIDAVPHGFRSSFRDWVGEKTSFPRELAEQALAHALQNKTEAAYRRGDALEKRRLMMQDWADFCYSGSVAGVDGRASAFSPQTPGFGRWA